MKSIIVLVYSLIIGSSAFAYHTGNVNGQRLIDQKNINERLLRYFKEHFPNAKEVVWEEQLDNYIVNFVENDVRTHIVYDREGTFISSIRYYKEQQLPSYLLDILKKHYAGKTVFAVTEQTSEAGVVYFIKMEDAKGWIIVKMDSEGNHGIVERYSKAS